MRTLVALVALVALTVSPCFAAGVVNISSTQAKALLAKNGRTVLLDVRTPEEYRQARLRGSLLIPLGELEKRVKEIPRDRPLLVYCAVGARSSSAAGFLASKGYREIYHMSDGLVGWYKNGFPIEKP
ncbi:MAG: rhodanese-like domain-containing protein [Geobacteraceae bacterium GWC2_58_44]|nr:MAG: rhodanese-like domain-containing protein [Geobacteraceae bacterium GWC2_58_44]HBG04989.1 rhodanese-like domain-containing protein [Geobacter sp.]